MLQVAEVTNHTPAPCLVQPAHHESSPCSPFPQRTIECQRNEAQLLSAAFYEVISQDERRKTSASAKGVTAKSSPIKSSWLERKRMESRKARQSPG